MNSPKANLFLSLQDRITALQDTDDQPYFAYIDQDLGQMEIQNSAGNYPVSWPCVLIDIDAFLPTDVSQNAQVGTATVKLRMGFTPFSSSSSITEQQYRERAIYYYDLEQVLHLALQGWSPAQQTGYEDLAEIFGSFDRKSSTTEHRTDFVRVQVLEYTIGFTDNTTKLQQQFASVTGVNLTNGFTE